MAHLVCYDIADNSLRTKIGKKILEAGLDRINKSVYLGTITESGLKQLEVWLNSQMNTSSDSQDSLIIIPVNAQQIQQMRVLGRNDLDKDELSGDKSTLIF